MSTEQGPATSELAYSAAERHPLVEALISSQRWPQLRLAIHAEDEMYRFARSEQHQHRGLALAAYLRSGLLANDAILQVLHCRFGSELASLHRLLDFGAGFGRVTRFLAAELGTDRVSACDINPLAVDFQRRELDLSAFRS